MVETERLYLRPLTRDDFDNRCVTLRDEQARYAYEGAFADAEGRERLRRQACSL